MERQLEQEQIIKKKSTQLAELARDIEFLAEQKKKDLAEFDRNTALELVRRAREIAIAGEEKAIALAKSELAKALTQKEGAEEETLHLKVKSQAERQKIAAVIRAEEQATLKRMERELAVELDAREIIELAQAKRDASENEAEAIEILSKARRTEAAVRAEAERIMVEARNLTSEHILKDARYQQLIGEMAKIAGELVKPAEKIDSIKIVHLNGFGGTPLLRETGEGAEGTVFSQMGAQSAISTIISGILQVGAFRPVFRQLLGEDGIAELDQHRLIQMLNDLVPGLIETGAKEVVKTAVRKELDKPHEKTSQSDDSETT
jgi:hypothetical protein